MIINNVKAPHVNWKLTNQLAPYCFGIYLMPLVFINFAYKLLSVDEEVVVSIYNFIGFFLLFTLLSLVSTYILMQTPFMKKHVFQAN